MKQNEIDNIHQLKPQNYENIFDVYEDNSNGMYYYNLLTTVNFPTDLDPATYQEYTTATKDNWSYIAWKFYGDVRLWWLICTVNQITNPLISPAPGTKLKILNLSTARSVLNTITKS